MAKTLTRTITGRQAIIEAIREEMRADPKIILYGEDVGKFGGVFGTTAGLYEEFGSDRVFDTPVTETTIIGSALGLALTGMRPIVELQFADFVDIAMDEIANKLGKWRYMHGGEFFKVPVTVRLPMGILGGAGPEHSQCPYATFLHKPGLQVVVPSSPLELKGLLKTAIREDNPTLFFEHKLLYDFKEEVSISEDFTLPFGQAAIKRNGDDVTIFAVSYMVHVALEAAKELEKQGIQAEVIDPRTLVPLDKKTLLESVKKTGRILIVHEEPTRGGSGAEIAAIIAEEAIYDLKAPVKRLGGPNVPIAQSAYLEQYYRPNVKQIVQEVQNLMAY